MDQIQISLFNGFKDTIPKKWVGTWDDFICIFIGTEPKYAKVYKKDLPSFSPTTYMENALRGRSHVIGINLIVLDVDKKPKKDVDNLIFELRTKSNLAFCGYTTYSHDEENIKKGLVNMRLIFLPSRSILREEWKKFYVNFLSLLPDLFDRVCSDVSRIYTLPYTLDVESGYCLSHGCDPIDVDQILSMHSRVEHYNSEEKILNQEISRDDLKKFAKKLLAQKSSYHRSIGRYIEKIAKGEPFAKPGFRHNTALEVAKVLEREFYLTSIDDLTRLFERSVHSMRTHDYTPEDEIEDIRHILEGVRASRISYYEQLKEEKQQNILKSSDRVEPWSEEEIQHIREVQNLPESDYTRADLLKRLLAVHGDTVYILGVNGYHTPPIRTSNLLLAVKNFLGGAVTLGYTPEKDTTTGTTFKTKDELMLDYGFYVKNIKASYLIQRSIYDRVEQVFYESVCPRRKIEPQKNKIVQEWLEILANKDTKNFFNWLKLLPDLSEPLAALYLEGAPGSGKTLLVSGLSRLWGTSGPCMACDAVSDFNTGFLLNPIIFADEGLPSQWQKFDAGSKIREFIASRSRLLHRKYLSSMPLEGCIRLIGAANNSDLFTFKTNHTKLDREAIADRIYHLRINDEAVKFLKSLKSKTVKDFIYGDQIAAHILYLIETEPAARTSRFGVEGNKDSKYHKIQKERQFNNFIVYEWLIKFLVKPETFYSIAGQDKNLIFTHENELYVNIKAITSQIRWQIYVNNPFTVPPTSALSRALTDIAPNRKKHKNTQYRIIPIVELIEIAERYDLATKEEIERYSLEIKEG